MLYLEMSKFGRFRSQLLLPEDFLKVCWNPDDFSHLNPVESSQKFSCLFIDLLTMLYLEMGKIGWFRSELQSFEFAGPLHRDHRFLRRRPIRSEVRVCIFAIGKRHIGEMAEIYSEKASGSEKIDKWKWKVWRGSCEVRWEVDGEMSLQVGVFLEWTGNILIYWLIPFAFSLSDQLPDW